MSDEISNDEDLSRFYAEDEDGNVMADPERVVSDEEALAALESSIEDVEDEEPATEGDREVISELPNGIVKTTQVR